ncbi:1514_t:CDS:1 [Paraglomus brasilianum]|uniref:1514_t:CDS:1 n=1 Tax=Paraglomus brasilianum TaxID=144538 RepID=A0A9N9FQL4_9GLOM|nr:1514_t:CDS:1 [Paraglomus brasilianum]
MGTIIVTLLHPVEHEDDILVILNLIAFSINTIFLIELTLRLLAFRCTPFYKGEYWFLSLFDAIVVISTFTLDVILTGNLREVASLLVVFRFWRIVEVTEVAALGVARYDEEYDRQRNQKVKELEGQLNKILKAVEKIANEDDWDDSKRERIFGYSTIPFVRSYYD